MTGPPLVIVEGGSPALIEQALSEAAEAGWQIVEGWSEAGRGVVCQGRVDDEAAAVRAVLAALAGAGVIVEATAPREVLDRLCDDLRHLGRLDHRMGEPATTPVLTAEERTLLELLLGGASLGDAARCLHLSRRTVDRRLASARRALGAGTTSEAVVLAGRTGLRGTSTAAKAESER